ncbi:zinc finger protein basonuclin-2-like isoform X1 [Solea solea]|uniref:zinc finger protein basonuclin-2-like isoform X1 n=1 Tax=Solea solea TaxID=90069 RepID=UPI00272DB0AE|nr:zinc finger protein basonuclin-2-like isoform X1 [Solea solea]
MYILYVCLCCSQSVSCSVSSCSCRCFKPGNVKFRSCDRCGHGWVVHALEKLRAPPSSSCGPAEVALPGLVLDLSSLVLFGAQAVPVRLKILLDRLFSVLTPDQVGHILHTLGWSLGDYVRGYMLQFPSGTVLERWTMATPEEELLILKQFLRFGETRPIAELMMPQCLAAVNHHSDPDPAPKSCHSNIDSFTECKGTSRNSREDVRHFEDLPCGRPLLPVRLPSSAFKHLVPSNQDLAPPPRLTQHLQEPRGKFTQKHGQEGKRDAQENDLLESKCEPVFKIKADPDSPVQSRSLWHPNINSDDEVNLLRGVAKQETASLPSPPSFIPVSSSFCPFISSSASSPPRIYPRLQSSSPSCFHPLPSFSSSFLCPSPAISFSSSLHPLPPSPCSLPSSPAGSRKGRVYCGVCGKSFYDKGTLKIHYNAVHLKIKHRCTVSGCTMVFSSLRSRNRHSANPNPRLHTGSNRDGPSEQCTQDGDSCTLERVHRPRNGLNGQTYSRPPQTDSPPPSPSPCNDHDSTLSLTPLAVMKETECVATLNTYNNTAPVSLSGHAPITMANCTKGNQGALTDQQQQWESCDSVPKKKPRKSSTPVKIERGKKEGRSNKKEEEF